MSKVLYYSQITMVIWEWCIHMSCLMLLLMLLLAVAVVAEYIVADLVVLIEMLVYLPQKSDHTELQDRNFALYKAAAVRLPVLLGY